MALSGYLLSKAESDSDIEGIAHPSTVRNMLLTSILKSLKSLFSMPNTSQSTERMIGGDGASETDGMPIFKAPEAIQKYLAWKEI